MNIRNRKPSTLHKGLVTGVVALALGMGINGSAVAGHGAAWGIGGLIAGHALTKMSDRDKRQTQAAEYQAYNQPPPAAAPAASSTSSVEQKLNELDALAAKGYITKAEYTARRKALLDTL
ncbi:MAG: SHOCT domain-containing protein [Pseudomonadota bacterium]|nr:SHOCT domain-containing protein [Pseudomonadota bacterium]